MYEKLKLAKSKLEEARKHLDPRDENLFNAIAVADDQVGAAMRILERRSTETAGQMRIPLGPCKEYVPSLEGKPDHCDNCKLPRNSHVMDYIGTRRQISSGGEG